MTKTRFLALAAAAAVAAGCSKPALRRAAAPVPTPAPVADQGADGQRSGEPDVRDRVMSRIPGVDDVRFAYDSDVLDEAARGVLKRNAEYLDAHPETRVQIAGHCDPRGTVEYNLALGQRRAAAVRAYYVQLGVPGARLATISYGKERPACAQASEECYRKDRRAETLGAVAAIVSRGPSRDAVPR